jgi:hypothetical protein
VTVEKEERELVDIIKIELGFLLITIIKNAVVQRIVKAPFVCFCGNISEKN